MLKVISYLEDACKPLINKHIPVSLILKTGIFEDVIKMKYDVPNNNIALLDTYYEKIDHALASVD